MLVCACAQYFRQQQRLNKQAQHGDIDDYLLPRGLDDHPCRRSRGRPKEGDPDRDDGIDYKYHPQGDVDPGNPFRQAFRAHHRQQEKEVRYYEDHQSGINAEIVQPRDEVLWHDTNTYETETRDQLTQSSQTAEPDGEG